MPYKQSVTQEEDRELGYDDLPSAMRTRIWEECRRSPRPSCGKLSDVVGKRYWFDPASPIPPVPGHHGNTSIITLMRFLNKHGYALASPPLESTLVILLVSAQTRAAFSRAGMVHLDHVVSRTRSQALGLLRTYGIKLPDARAAVAEVEERLHGVGLDFREPRKRK